MDSCGAKNIQGFVLQSPMLRRTYPFRMIGSSWNGVQARIPRECGNKCLHCLQKKSEHGMWGAWIEHVWRSKQERNEQLCVSDRSDRRRWQKRQIYESIELFGQLLHSIDCHGKCRQLTWSVHQWRHNLKLRNQIYRSLSNIYWDSWIYIQT